MTQFGEDGQGDKAVMLAPTSLGCVDPQLEKQIKKQTSTKGNTIRIVTTTQ